jgi:hypothetical protein
MGAVISAWCDGGVAVLRFRSAMADCSVGRLLVALGGL